MFSELQMRTARGFAMRTMPRSVCPMRRAVPFSRSKPAEDETFTNEGTRSNTDGARANTSPSPSPSPSPSSSPSSFRPSASTWFATLRGRKGLPPSRLSKVCSQGMFSAR